MSENNNKNIWFELRKGELSLNEQRFENEKKLRRNREFILFITCLIGLMYFLPMDSIENNAAIEISAISLKLDLIYAIYIYPTLIAIIYILVISSSLTQSQLMSLIIQTKKELVDYEVNLEIPNPKLYLDHKVSLRYLILPSLLHSNFLTDSKVAISLGKIIMYFISFVYFFVPLCGNFMLIQKVNNLVGSWWLYLWNIICFLMMIISYLNAFFSIKHFKNQTA